MSSLDFPLRCYPANMDLISTPDQLPKDRSKIADDTMITTPVWAKLQGVKPSTVSRKLADAKLRRAAGESRPGDMPAEDARVGNSPVWTMKTYRAWDKQRPGMGAGAGRPPGAGVRGPTPRALHLPEECPHCKLTITGPDVRELRAAKRAGEPAARVDQRVASDLDGEGHAGIKVTDIGAVLVEDDRSISLANLPETISTDDGLRLAQAIISVVEHLKKDAG